MYEGIQDIYHLLDAGRLKEALTQMQALGTQTNRWDLRNRIESTLTAYGYMLQYAQQGMQDPNRSNFYRQTLRSAYEMTDLLNVTLMALREPALYYNHLRTYALRSPRTYADLQMVLEAYTEDNATAHLLNRHPESLEKERQRIEQIHEEAVTELFDRTWATPLWSEEEAKEAQKMVQSVLVPTNDIAVMVSATTLALLRVFDIRKLNFLLDTYSHESLQVNQRALIGILIALQKHTQRIQLYPDIQARITLMGENETFRNNLRTLQMQFLITRETTKIDKQMREEIIPEMMKNPKLQHSKFRFDETEDPEDRNPEWEEWIDKSGISDKIKQMSEWQMAGADVYMSSFAQLKHYPFFRKMAHWFYPFDINLPLLAPIRKQFEESEISPFKLIVHSEFFCNSDKYSFCLTMNSMPGMLRQQAIKQLEEQASSDPDAMNKLKNLMKYTPTAKNVSRQYIQDLYRFCKLWQNRQEEEDIFLQKFDFWNNPLLKDSLAQAETTKELADYLLQKDYPTEAYELYTQLIATSPTAELYQKAGYILQKQKQYSEALYHYEKADLLKPDSVWTNKHIAQCYKLKGDMHKALEYYRKVEEVQPDNLGIALQIGQCLARMEQYTEALAYFYKVEYLEKNPDNARRAIAWCSFLSSKHEEALKYYNQLIEGPSAKPQDWMNAGHVHLVNHRYAKALEHYKHAQEAEESHTAFIDKFNKDRDALHALGIADEELNIVLDLLI